MSAPSVSVIITAFDRVDFIDEAFESVVNQTLDKSEYEIIVTKNFTYEPLDKHSDEPNVLILRNNNNIGSMLSEAISRSTGTIICFLNDDDRFKAEKLEIVLSTFRSIPNVGYYHNSMTWIDLYGRRINNSFLKQPDKRIVMKVKNKKDLYNLKRMNVDVNDSCICINRNILDGKLGYLARLEINQDVFLLHAAISASMQVIGDSEVLTEYRLHKNTSHADLGIGKTNNDIIKLRSKYESSMRIISEFQSNEVALEVMKNELALNHVEAKFFSNGTISDVLESVCMLIKNINRFNYKIVLLSLVFITTNHFFKKSMPALYSRIRHGKIVLKMAGRL